MRNSTRFVTILTAVTLTCLAAVAADPPPYSYDDFTPSEDCAMCHVDIARQHEHTKCIDTVLYHDAFPVDVRHNAKIFREKLATWAQEQLT